LLRSAQKCLNYLPCVVDYYSNTKCIPQEEGRPNNNATGGGEE
jgi:hypothetical protein